METTIIIMFALSTILFILSLLQKDRSSKFEEQLENQSIRYMQEMYQLKRKISSLEEALLSSETFDNSLNRDDALAMYEDGYSIEEIAQFANITPEDVESLLANQ
ncbi:hypothetical protein [Texcoconibacillus texcoconensis]|uniref:DNA-binding CsgD family transcriptional regulator n=1 Tax=Texcoconibacillus texcoconensis TaxID=1095777 RepID=A0A840QP31_9BACI|nr:DNA-binding CsgD family transcriptional regulator [Texcoconibacillus texcoconensis]